MPKPDGDMLWVPPRRPTPRQALVLVVFAVAIAQLLVSNLDPNAPLRQGFGPKTPMAQQAARMPSLTQPVVELADGRNIQLHYARPDALPPAGQTLVEALYFGLNYRLFPARAYVGQGSETINDGATLSRADRVPPMRAMRERGVAAVVTFPIDDQGLHRPTAVRVR